MQYLQQNKIVFIFDRRIDIIKMKKSIDEEAFHSFETKIDAVVSILHQMNSCDKAEQKNGIHRADKLVRKQQQNSK